MTRDRFIGADIATPFGNIPFANVPSSHTDEFRFSARRSRLSFLALGDVDPATHLAGWDEFDFLGAAQTANSNESNSYKARRSGMKTSSSPAFATIRSKRETAALAHRARWRNGQRACYGVAANGNDLISLARAWRKILPKAEFIAPNAPFPCDYAPEAQQWFSMQDRASEKSPA